MFVGVGIPVSEKLKIKKKEKRLFYELIAG